MQVATRDGLFWSDAVRTAANRAKDGSYSKAVDAVRKGRLKPRKVVFRKGRRASMRDRGQPGTAERRFRFCSLQTGLPVIFFPTRLLECCYSGFSTRLPGCCYPGIFLFSALFLAAGCLSWLTIRSPKRIIRSPCRPGRNRCGEMNNAAPVAQLDRVSGYEPEGREFESLRARHLFRSMSNEYTMK